MDWRPWWATVHWVSRVTVHWVAKSWTWLSDFTREGEKTMWAHREKMPICTSRTAASEETSPAYTSVLDFQPPGLWEVNFCCLSPWVCGPCTGSPIGTTHCLTPFIFKNQGWEVLIHFFTIEYLPITWVIKSYYLLFRTNYIKKA